MDAFGGQIPPDGIWRIVSFIRAQQPTRRAEAEKREHEPAESTEGRRRPWKRTSRHRGRARGARRRPARSRWAGGVLFCGLIVWGVYYAWTYTPSLGGWSQGKAYEESVQAAPAAAGEAGANIFMTILFTALPDRRGDRVCGCPQRRPLRGGREPRDRCPGDDWVYLVFGLTPLRGASSASGSSTTSRRSGRRASRRRSTRCSMTTSSGTIQRCAAGAAAGRPGASSSSGCPSSASGARARSASTCPRLHAPRLRRHPLDGRVLRRCCPPTLALALVFLLVTVACGRVWCGWSCPQTVLGDLTRRCRRSAPGRGGARRRAGARAGRPWRWSRWSSRRPPLWYFVPPGRVPRAPRSPARPRPGAGRSLGGALGVTLFLDLGFVRGRFCATACPYAKLQGVLFDRATLVVAYDERRDADCIDCGACVRLLPHRHRHPRRAAGGVHRLRGVRRRLPAHHAEAEAEARPGRLLLRRAGRPRRGPPRPVGAGARRRLAPRRRRHGGGGPRRRPRPASTSPWSPPAASPRAAAPDGRVVNAYDVSLENRGRRARDAAAHPGRRPAAEATRQPGPGRARARGAPARLPGRVGVRPRTRTGGAGHLTATASRAVIPSRAQVPCSCRGSP